MPDLDVVITAAAGRVVASTIHVWKREDSLEHTAADTLRNHVIAIFDQNSAVMKIVLVFTRGGVPLLIAEAEHRWFHCGPGAKATPINVTRLLSTPDTCERSSQPEGSEGLPKKESV